MKLVVLSNPSSLVDEHLIINYMFELGLQHFHVRKPDYSEDDLRKYVEKIPRKYWSKLMIHSHHKLAKEFDGIGIHFNLASPESNEKYEWLSPKSISCHTLDELEDLDTQIKYAFLSPVFNSISKQGYNSLFDQDQLKKFLDELTVKSKIIALGGIETDKIQRCYEMGFDGVGVLGAIWEVYKESGVQQAIENFKQINRECQRLTV